MFFVATFFEGEFDSLHEFASSEAAFSFAIGVNFGASKYGAGSAVGYVLPVPQEDIDMVSNENADEVARCRTALKILGLKLKGA